MATKEELQRIGQLFELQKALDDANKRIAELAAKTPKSELVGYGAWMTHAKVAEAKLAKVREWAEQYHGETFSGPGVDALIAILDGNDAEKQEK